MLSRKRRLLFAALIAVSVGLGVMLEAALDPIEHTRPGLTVIGLLLGLIAGGGVLGHWYSRKTKAMDDPDERYQEIERRSSRFSHGTLVAGVAVLATILLIPWIDIPVAEVLWALLIGSVAVHELSVEYYSRLM